MIFTIEGGSSWLFQGIFSSDESNGSGKELDRWMGSAFWLWIRLEWTPRGEDSTLRLKISYASYDNNRVRIDYFNIKIECSMWVVHLQ